MFTNFTCPMCYPGATEIGKIAGHYYLTKLTNEKYVIMGGQGHLDDDVFTFQSTPEVDPFDEMTDDEINQAPPILVSKQAAYQDKLDNVRIIMDCLEGYNLITACLKDGIYDFERDGSNFNAFLFNHCGKMIRDYNKNENDL